MFELTRQAVRQAIRKTGRDRQYIPWRQGQHNIAPTATRGQPALYYIMIVINPVIIVVVSSQ